jgi:hypothetical protein
MASGLEQSEIRRIGRVVVERVGNLAAMCSVERSDNVIRDVATNFTGAMHCIAGDIGLEQLYLRMLGQSGNDNRELLAVELIYTPQRPQELDQHNKVDDGFIAGWQPVDQSSSGRSLSHVVIREKENDDVRVETDHSAAVLLGF